MRRSGRAGAPVRAGAARAVGDPSPTLEREAQQERGFVVKDFRRIGLVVAIMAALLIVSDIAVNALLPYVKKAHVTATDGKLTFSFEIKIDA